mgnify:CR=1 FL=1
MPQTSLPKPGVLLVVSGPSGAGKTTLCQRLSVEDPNVIHSVSCTTRAPREGETDGESYFFLNVEEFEKKIENGEFLEHALVHGNHYGTLLEWVRKHLASGTHVVMDIDVQGAEQIRNHPDPFIAECRADLFIFLSEDELTSRLHARASESEDQLAVRLKNARDELAQWPNYQYVISSRSREEDYARFCAIVEGEKQRSIDEVAR